MLSILNSSNTNSNHSSSVNNEHYPVNLVRGHLKLDDTLHSERMMDIYEEGSEHRFDKKRIILNVGGVRHGKYKSINY